MTNCDKLSKNLTSTNNLMAIHKKTNRPSMFQICKMTIIHSCLFNKYKEKLVIFPYTCLFAFFEITIIISGVHPINISGKSVSLYALYSFIFSLLRSVITTRKHLYNQTSHYRKYGMHDHQSARPSY